MIYLWRWQKHIQEQTKIITKFNLIINNATNEMHATGITSSPSITSIVKSANMLASTLWLEISTTGGVDNVTFKFMS